MQKETLICGLNPTEIEEIKKEKGALVLVSVKEGDNEHQAIFREPSFDQLKAMSKISKSDEIEGVKVAYNNAIIVADEAIQTRDILKIKAVQSLMERTNKTTAEAKNL